MKARHAKMSVWSVFGIAVTAFVLATSVAGYLVADPGFAGAKGAIPALAPAGPVAGSGELPASGTFAPIVEKTAPAVVSIEVSKVVSASEGPMRFPFFGPHGPRQRPEEGPERRRRGSGSGVIISQDGYIVTNHHVIDGAGDIRVRLNDRREFDATVVGTDAKTDVAVLKVDTSGLPVLPLGNSDNVAIGDIVLAIGNPFGIGQTVTMGIVGATGRRGLHIEDYEDFIQTDAAINPGNSGGALVNARGELIGINTAIFSRGSGGNQGIGFAVPINLAHRVMTQLTETGRVARGYLGVGIQPVTPKMAKLLGAPETRGAVVSSVQPASPAEEAGLQRGDIIFGLDEEQVDDFRHLRLNLASRSPGSEVELLVWRDGDEMRLPAKLTELPEDGRPAARPRGATSSSRGLSVDELTPRIAERLGLAPDTEGVIISGVKPGSPAAQAGLQRGDVIQEVARRSLRTVSEFRQAVGEAGDEPVLLLVVRDGNPLFMVVEAS